MQNPVPSDRIDRWSRLLVVALAALLPLVVALRISGYRYLPTDDALRHAAHAVGSRSWSEVLVLNDRIHPNVDSHPGWHATLRFIHQSTGIDAEGLVVLSFVFTYCIVVLVGLSASRNALAWLATLAASSVLVPEFWLRALLGRPLNLSTAVLLAFSFWWSGRKKGDHYPFGREFALTTAGLAVAIVAHPSWYLWLICLPSLWIGLGVRTAARFAAGLLLALAIAAALAGSFYNIVQYPLEHLFLSLSQDPLIRSSLVIEFQPNRGAATALLLGLMMVLARRATGIDRSDPLLKPDFVLTIVGWTLGLYVSRFWTDWGALGFITWTCRQIALLVMSRTWTPSMRLGSATLAALVVYLAMTSDIEGRYSDTGRQPILTMPKDQLAAAMPSAGGILYCTDMRFFYESYFRLPDTNWRYVVGFEPGMMRPADLETLRQIQYGGDMPGQYAPWVAAMRPEDRIMFRSVGRPPWANLAYSQLPGNWWVGRLAPTESTPTTK